jgi:hypothetical protein
MNTYGPETIMITIIVVIAVIAALLIPALFYISTLSKALQRCAPSRRAMPPGQAWFLLIPLFNMVFHFIIVSRIADSLRNEFTFRQLPLSEREPGKNLGITFCILNLTAWIPLLGILTGLAGFVCWIVYWVRIADYSRRISQPAMQVEIQPSALDSTGPVSANAGEAAAIAQPVFQARRSSVPLVIGTTLIVGAGVLMLLAFFGSAMSYWMRTSSYSGVSIPKTGTEDAQLAMAFVRGALSLLALASGIGLVRYRAWGRNMAIGWAMAALADLAIETTVNMVYIMPASQRAMESINLPGGTAQAMQAAGTVGIAGSLVWALILAVTPVITLILMPKEKVRRSCA